MKIISSSPKFVSFAVVVVLVGVSTHTFAASSEQSAATSDSKSVKSASAAPILTYRPPLRGAPTTRVGGGTRSSSYALLTLTALAPNHTGYTFSDTPTLYWYVSNAINLPIEITLTVEETTEPLLEVTLDAPIQKGIHALRLKDHGMSLKPGVEYQWFVAVVRDPDQRSKDILAGGSIKWVAASQAVQARLDETGKVDWPSVYAESGLWYDAVEGISKLIDADPADLKLREQRASLLDQVGLVEAAAYDRKTGK